MEFRLASIAIIALGLLELSSEVAIAQQTTVGSNFGRVGSSFSSGVQVGYGSNLRGGRPTANNHGGGFSLRSGSGFSLSGGQRSTRRSGSVATSVTVLNGQTGFFAAGVIRPWVTGVIPIVGGQPSVGQIVSRLPGRPAASNPLYERLARLQAEKDNPRRSSTATRSSGRRPTHRAAQASDVHKQRLDEAAASSAGQATAGLAEIRVQKAAQAAAIARRVTENFEKGSQAQRDGKLALARNYYRLAAREAAGAMRQEIATRLAEIARKPRD